MRVKTSASKDVTLTISLLANKADSSATLIRVDVRGKINTSAKK